MIRLKIDDDGEPYLILNATGSDAIREDVVKLFIKEARRRGIIIKNESSLETDNIYASIRLKKNNLKQG